MSGWKYLSRGEVIVKQADYARSEPMSVYRRIGYQSSILDAIYVSCNPLRSSISSHLSKGNMQSVQADLSIASSLSLCERRAVDLRDG